MPPLNNYRHELFAQELAMGKSAIESYTNAGYRLNYGNAQRLKTNEQIQGRITQIQQRGATRVDISRADIINMVLEDRKGAIECNQYAVALKADDMLGRELHSMFVEKKEIGAPGDFAAMQSAHDILEAAKAQLGNELAERLMHIFTNTIDNDAQAPALLIESAINNQEQHSAAQANGCEASASPDLAQLEQTNNALEHEPSNAPTTQRCASAGKADSSS